MNNRWKDPRLKIFQIHLCWNIHKLNISLLAGTLEFRSWCAPVYWQSLMFLANQKDHLYSAFKLGITNWGISVQQCLLRAGKLMSLMSWSHCLASPLSHHHCPLWCQHLFAPIQPSFLSCQRDISFMFCFTGKDLELGWKFSSTFKRSVCLEVTKSVFEKYLC